MLHTYMFQGAYDLCTYTEVYIIIGKWWIFDKFFFFSEILKIFVKKIKIIAKTGMAFMHIPEPQKNDCIPVYGASTMEFGLVYIKFETPAYEIQNQNKSK